MAMHVAAMKPVSLSASDVPAALIETEMKALKAGILEANDQRFKIVEETIRESAPSKADYIKIHGEAEFEKNKKVTTVKRHVKGIA